MKKNPLTMIVLVFAIGDVYTMWQAFISHNVPVFTAIAWVQGVILLALYLNKSPHAGSYLFYSTLPLFPIYYGLRLAGLAPRPKTLAIYLVATVIYIIAMPLMWRTKREYDQYIATTRV